MTSPEKKDLLDLTFQLSEVSVAKPFSLLPDDILFANFKPIIDEIAVPEPLADFPPLTLDVPDSLQIPEPDLALALTSMDADDLPQPETLLPEDSIQLPTTSATTASDDGASSSPNTSNQIGVDLQGGGSGDLFADQAARSFTPGAAISPDQVPEPGSDALFIFGITALLASFKFRQL